MGITRHLIIGSILVFLLNSCALFDAEPARVYRAQDREMLYRLERWLLEGRVGIQGSKESWHGNLVWAHEAATDQLRISGPFGQGTIDIYLKDDFIRLTQADGTREESNDAESLFLSRLGITVPVSALRYWVLGLPDPTDDGVYDYDELGRLRSLNQLGWEVEYDAYMVVDPWVLPRKLEIMKGAARLKLVVDEWEFEN